MSDDSKDRFLADPVRALPTVTDEVRAIGDAWMVRGSSAVLRVPSVLVPQEHNFLLNTRHEDFRKLRIGGPRPFRFDPRLAGCDEVEPWFDVYSSL